MTSSITAPLERQFGQMPGLKQMSSTSSGGASVITLQFSLELSLDVAEQEVQAAINAAANLLPTDLPVPPIYSKVNPADAPILTLGVTSKTLPLPEVQNLVDTRLAQKISQLPGVGLVTLSGGQRPAVRIQANPKALAAYGLGLDDLRTAIAAANVNQAKGSFDGPQRASTIDANDQLRSADEYRSAHHRLQERRADPPLRRRRRRSTTPRTCASPRGRTTAPAVIVNIQRQPGANVIEVVDRVKKLLPQLQATLPGVGRRGAAHRPHHHHPRLGARRADRAAARGGAGGDGDLPVPAQRRRDHHSRASRCRCRWSARSASCTSPGFCINNLTLMALTIATGFVVDDAIVMIENISRYIEEGEPPLEAALKGSRADRLHHHLADLLADRGADSAAVHGRRRRAPVPRVRDHARGGDPDLGGGLAHAHADDVRASCCATRRKPSRAGSTARPGGSSTR